MLKITREGADLIDSGLIDKKAIKLKVRHGISNIE